MAGFGQILVSVKLQVLVICLWPSLNWPSLNIEFLGGHINLFIQWYMEIPGNSIKATSKNLILEAHSLGLGTAWVSAFDEDAIKRILRVEEFARPQAIIPLGYAAEIPSKPPKYPLETVVFFNVWRNRVRDPARYMREYSIVIARELKKTKEVIKQVAGKIKEKILK